MFSSFSLPSQQFRLIGLGGLFGLWSIQTHQLHLPLLLGTCISIFLWIVWRKWEIIICIAFFGMGFYSSLSHRDIQEHILPLHFHNTTVVFEGWVDSFPEEKEKQTQFIINGNIHINNRIIQTRMLVQDTKKNVFPPGSFIEGEGKLMIPQPFETFDYARYLQRLHVYSIIKPTNIEHKPHQDKYSFTRTGYTLRSRFQKNIEDHLPSPHQQIAMGILFGIKKELPPYTDTAFSRAGLTHILVVSGFNVTVIMLIVGALLRPLGMSLVFVGTILILGLFLLLTGFDPPIIRAICMGSLSAWALSIGRKSDTKNIIIMTFLIIGLFNPLIIQRDIGFFLSAFATLAIVLWSESIAKYFLFLSEKIRTILSVTLAAQISVMGLIIYFFGSFPFIGLVSNIVIEPLVPLAMGLSALVSFLGWIPNPIGGIIAIPAISVIEVLLFLGSFFGKIDPISLPRWVGMIGIGIVIAFFLLSLWPQKKK